MASIYANAYVTIVAAGGTTAFFGLRGIEGVTPPMVRARRVPEYLLHSQEHAVECMTKELHERITRSTWSQRAWTFQEQVFSRRLLVLEPESVAWECHCAVWLDGMEPGEGGLEPGPCRNGKTVAIQGLSFGTRPSLTDYARHVTQFNRRALTYPEDALDAFSGIMWVLERTTFAAPGGGFICGLPVLFFDAALLWYNKVPLKRRRVARRERHNAPVLPPSWAWAAWAGPVDFPDYEIDGDSLHRHPNIRPVVKWWYRETNRDPWRPVSSVWTRQSQGGSGINPEEPGAFARDEENGDAKARDAGLSTISHQIGRHLLLSYPLRARFRVLGFSEQVRLLVADESGESVGVLTSCEACPGCDTDPFGLICEVVALSESHFQGLDVYNVLWIDWKDNVAYRRGVGWIVKSAWKASETERIRLILC